MAGNRKGGQARRLGGRWQRGKRQVTERRVAGTDRGTGGRSAPRGDVESSPMTRPPTAYERYAPWRRWVEVGFVGTVLAVNADGTSHPTGVARAPGGGQPSQPSAPGV